MVKASGSNQSNQGSSGANLNKNHVKNYMAGGKPMSLDNMSNPIHNQNRMPYQNNTGSTVSRGSKYNGNNGSNMAYMGKGMSNI